MVNAKVGFSKAFQFGWIKREKKDDGSVSIEKKVCVT